MKNLSKRTKKYLAWAWFISIIIVLFLTAVINMSSEEFWGMIGFIVFMVGFILFIVISWKALMALTND